MTRTLLSSLAIAFAGLTVHHMAVPAVAIAQPSAKDLAEAKKAFAEGKKAHEAGDLGTAIAKFSKSYSLSKNPLLLYNIAVTMEEDGQLDFALDYYKKFLAEAPADAAQRPQAQESMAALEKKLGKPASVENTGTKPPVENPPDRTPKGPVEIKPAGTYSETDFQHEVVDVAPPGKPLDITAYVPEDSGWTVTLNFRTAGEGTFTAKEMKWRYKELVGRVPAPKMIGDALQYFVEVKDQGGAVIAKSGKSTSPNLITIEKGATPRFYPDVTDDGDPKTPTDVVGSDDSDDPLRGGKKDPVESDDPITGPVDDPQTETLGGTGFRDVGSSKFKYMKWGSTIATGALLGSSLVFYLQAGRNADALVGDSTNCGDPPCQEFDSTSAGYEDAGKLNDTLSKVTLGIGAVTAVVAGYYWYKSLTAKKRGSSSAAAANDGSPETTWVVAPAFGQGFAGAAAAVEF